MLRYYVHVYVPLVIFVFFDLLGVVFARVHGMRTSTNKGKNSGAPTAPPPPPSIPCL